MGQMVTQLSWVMFCKEEGSISQMPCVVNFTSFLTNFVFCPIRWTTVTQASCGDSHNIHGFTPLTSLPGCPGLGSLCLWPIVQRRSHPHSMLPGEPGPAGRLLYQLREVGSHGLNCWHCSFPHVQGLKEFTFLLWTSVFPSVEWES